MQRGAVQMYKQKPPISSLASYLKDQIPGCNITNEEVTELKRIYPQIAYKDINRVFHEAINKRALQPFSYILRRLQIIKPSNDPFKLNPQAKYNGRGVRVEIGTDWDTKTAQLHEKKEQYRQQYDQVHGAGAYDKKHDQEMARLKEIYKGLTNK